MSRILLTLPLLLACSTSFGQDVDKRSPLDAYQGDTFFFLTSCKLKFDLALLKSEASESQDEDSNFAGCISRGKPAAKAALDRALRTVRKPRAQEALKTYHVAFVTALEGIRPGADERKISYEQRQQALKEKLTEAWARFEIEK